MITTLLIANRGEIAVRIAAACRELGIESVAVYSDADRDAPHVRAADRAVHIGASPARESYLSIPRVLDAAAGTGADAVHPGYGFLSENAAFARACAERGVVFVGPPAEVIERMGSKIAARDTARAAGVPVVPGETPEDQSDAGVARAVDRAGLPALIKAAAGGGGKGMRRVDDQSLLDDAIRAARREAVSAFGDGTLYVERLIERPRHVEVQVMGDAAGGVVHLFERDCSVQRRHQKVIEESPAPALGPALRARMTDAACRAARAAGYANAGTIEFLVETSGTRAGEFYFLEMNTRLQVEHPVTELVTGTDLVRAQLLVASGERLPWTQADLTQRGHAIEARVYAEDVEHGYLPQAGRLLLYREPRMPGLRIDSGVREGSDVPVHYDPLLAKVIAYGETRDLAIARLDAALRDFPILGVKTNVPFLRRVIGDARFAAAAVDVTFLDGDGARLAAPPDRAIPDHVRAAMAASPNGATPQPGTAPAIDPWQRLQGWRS